MSHSPPGPFFWAATTSCGAEAAVVVMMTTTTRRRPLMTASGVLRKRRKRRAATRSRRRSHLPARIQSLRYLPTRRAKIGSGTFKGASVASVRVGYLWPGDARRRFISCRVQDPAQKENLTSMLNRKPVPTPALKMAVRCPPPRATGRAVPSRMSAGCAKAKASGSQA